jgi:enamine deaminase RidA (YjgF/YER057c/UK114 family)
MWESRLKPSAALLGFMFVMVLVPTARGDEPRLSISGYDAVAYFTDGKPVQGKAEFEYLWRKSRWRFSNATHLDLFVRDPARYAPQYDGYCAMGVALGDVEAHKDMVDPEAWAIVDGKLYLAHTPHVLDAWRQNADGNIKKADESWSTVKNLPEPTVVGPPCRDKPVSVVVSLSGGGRWVLVGGQTPVDKNGNVVGKGDMRAQIEQVGKNIETCLQAAGASTSGIIKTATYVTDLDGFSKHADMWARYLGPELPSSTLVKVERLANPDFLVNIEAIANMN